jgi:hypothetical protein
MSHHINININMEACHMHVVLLPSNFVEFFTPCGVVVLDVANWVILSTK